MPQLLTSNATISCPHGGQGTITSPSTLLKIGSGFALKESDQGTIVCPFVKHPCTSFVLQSMGLNATTIAGQKAILATDFQQSDTGLPLTIVESQITAMDISSPGGGAAGGSSSGGGSGGTDSGGIAGDGSLPEELLDESPPIVLALVPTLAFSLATQLPAIAITTFTINHPYPLTWSLTLINSGMAYDLDITNGLPPGLVISPSGGEWDTSSLTITVTMTAAYMASLGPTIPGSPHSLYLTAVSQRGVPQFAEVQLTITP